MLEPSSNGYMILCLSDDVENADEFELEVFSDNAIDFKPATSLFDKYNFQVSKTGRWTNSNCGGTSSEKTFTINSFYILDVKTPDTNLMVEITSQSNLKLLLYLIKTDKKALNELNQREIDSAISPSECSTKYNSLISDIGKNPGTYLVVPCNFNKEEGIYELKFSSTKQIEVLEGNQRPYQIRKDYEVTMVNDSAYLSASNFNPVSM